MDSLFSPIEEFSMPVTDTTSVGPIPNFICTIEGWKTKIKNLHWSASNMNVHKLLDEIADFVSDFQDSLAEDYMGINGKFDSTFLKGNPCNCGNTLELLKDMCHQTNSFYSKIPQDNRYKGITSETETFIHNINKYLYLITLCE